jgi:hypothetical protein
MNKVCNDHVDPRYEHITYEDMVELDKIIGRHISLEEGIQHPEYVCPRTKVNLFSLLQKINFLE